MTINQVMVQRPFLVGSWNESKDTVNLLLCHRLVVTVQQMGGSDNEQRCNNENAVNLQAVDRSSNLSIRQPNPGQNDTSIVGSLWINNFDGAIFR